MPEVTSHTPGSVSYFELMTPILSWQQCIDFYGGLFGWDSENDPILGFAQMKLGGKAVASISISFDGPTFWLTHITVDDISTVALQAVTAGGAVILAPTTLVSLLFGEWKQAVIRDPAGAYFGLWQPGTRIGAQLVQDPGTLLWSDLRTSNIDPAKTYYGTVFGWGVHAYEIAGEGLITEWRLNGLNNRGGTTQFNPAWPTDSQPHWLPYFSVADTDATAQKAVALGGQVKVPPANTWIGRTAVLADPAGGNFRVAAIREPAG